jgi:hypothetical protein
MVWTLGRRQPGRDLKGRRKGKRTGPPSLAGAHSAGRTVRRELGSAHDEPAALSNNIFSAPAPEAFSAYALAACASLRFTRSLEPSSLFIRAFPLSSVRRNPTSCSPLPQSGHVSNDVTGRARKADEPRLDDPVRRRGDPCSCSNLIHPSITHHRHRAYATEGRYMLPR